MKKLFLFITLTLVFAPVVTFAEPYYDPMSGVCLVDCPVVQTPSLSGSAQSIPKTPTSFSMTDCVAKTGDTAGCQSMLDQYTKANQTQLDTSNTTGLVNSSQYDCPTGQTWSSTGSTNGQPGGCVPLPSASNTTAPATAASPSTPTPATCASGQPVNAQGSCDLGYTPLEPIPGLTASQSGQSLDFASLLRNVYKIAITIGALFSVLMLTVSGVRYMLSDVVTDKDKAKKRIWACIYGLVLIAASWLILNTINPQLVTFNLNPGTATITGSTNPSGTLAPAGPSGCIGSSCASAAQQAAVKDVQTNGLLNANPQDIPVAAATAQDQSASCTAPANGGVIYTGIAPGSNVLSNGSTPCQMQGFSTCTQLLGAGNIWCAVK